NRHLYFPPGAGALLGEPTVPVVFVESEKAVLALAALAARAGRKILVLGTGGCWGWRGKVGIEIGPLGDRREMRGPLPDLGRINWSSGRDTIICFDANCSTNRKVRVARRALAEEVAARGASLRDRKSTRLNSSHG